MALPPLATVEDFAEWVLDDPILGAGNYERARAYLVAASARVRAIAGRTWVDDEGELTEVPDDIATVTIGIAARKWQNPTGVVHDVVGPFSARYSEAASEGIYVTADERKIIERYRATSGLWTLSTTRGDIPDVGEFVDPRNGTIYAPVEGGEPIPFRDPV